MTDLYNILFSISAFTLVIAMLPQIVRCVRRRSADDVSMITGLLLFIHCTTKAIIELDQGARQLPLFELSCVNAFMITVGYSVMLRYRYPKIYRWVLSVPKRYWEWLSW